MTVGAAPRDPPNRAALLVVAGALTLGAVGLVVSGSQPSATPAPSAPIFDPAAHVSLTKYRWTLGGFGTVMVLSGSIRNANGFAVKDPVIRCVARGQSGTTIGEVSQPIFRRIPAGKTIRLHDQSMGFVSSQAANAYCEIKSVTPDIPLDAGTSTS